MEESVRQALNERAKRLKGPDDDGDLADLSFLRDTLKNVRIVALGEGSHGTSEHFRYKHRLVRFLAENMGFHTFIIESAMDACELVNDYVLYGRGSCAEALDALHFWTWNTREVAAMIEWMRRHNLTCRPGEEISFRGFDLQTGDVAARLLREKLLPLAGEDAEELARLIETCDRIEMNSGKPVFEKACQLLGWVKGYAPLLIARSSAEEYEHLLRSSEYLFRHAALCALGWDSERRDYWMAENVRWILSRLPEGSRAVLWAHNAHVSKSDEWTTMGHRLRDLYGDRYYTVGFALYEGSFRAKIYDSNIKKSGPLMEHALPAVPEDCWAHDLHQIAPGDYFLDLRSAVKGVPLIRDWAEQKKRCFSFGAVYDPVAVSPGFEWNRESLSAMFDGLVVTERTTAAKGNKSE